MGYCNKKVKTIFRSSKESQQRDKRFLATAESQRKQLSLSLVVFWCYCYNCLELSIARGKERQKKDLQKNSGAAATKKECLIILGNRNVYSKHNGAKCARTWRNPFVKLLVYIWDLLTFTLKKIIDAIPLPCRSMRTD